MRGNPLEIPLKAQPNAYAASFFMVDSTSSPGRRGLQSLGRLFGRWRRSLPRPQRHGFLRTMFSVATGRSSGTSSPSESDIGAAVGGFSSVRYVPADWGPDIQLQASDARDVLLESHDALCHICLEDFPPPPLRDSVTSTEDEYTAALVQLLPCRHVFHVSFLFYGLRCW